MSGEMLCRCGKPLSMHHDSREPNLPAGAILSHPGTPTPVPSEVAKTTAGEREGFPCGARACAGCGTCARAAGYPRHPDGWIDWQAVARHSNAPAEPDAGEVEALAEAIWNAMPAHHVGWRGLKGDSRDFYLGIAERLMPTLDRVRREEGERVLREAADYDGSGHYTAPPRWVREWLRDRAASVGRGEGL